MPNATALNVDAIAGFAASVYESAASTALAAERGMSREALALSVADDAQKCGILHPSLRGRLDRMTGDYAAILKRLDDLRVLVEGEAVPAKAPLRVC